MKGATVLLVKPQAMGDLVFPPLTVPVSHPNDITTLWLLHVEHVQKRRKPSRSERPLSYSTACEQ